MNNNKKRQPHPDEVVEQHEGETYYLLPDAHLRQHKYYQRKTRCDQLDIISKKKFERDDVIQDCELMQNHQTHLKHVLADDLCEMLMEQAAKAKEVVESADLMNKLLSMIISEDIDSMMCSYFSSEYALLWHAYVETPADKENRADSSFWHCDAGPQNHLKMLIYLNSYESHLGNTKFLDKTSTDELKAAGYIFNSIDVRSEDIGPLCRSRDIAPVETMYEDIEPGDALLFNPNALAHIGKIPEHQSRFMLQLCFVPSPRNWRYCIDNVWTPIPKCTGFEEGCKALLDYAHKKPKKVIERVMISAYGDISSKEHLKLLLHNMYANAEFADMMYTRLIEADPELEQLNSVDAVLDTLRQSFLHSIDWDGDLGTENMENLSRLATYQVELKDSFSRYTAEDKPIPAAIFWPSPSHPTKPSTKLGMLPFVKKHPIMDINTPIGSAGSCFAFEIARVFQQMGYNYVITERNDDPACGIAVDGYQSGDKYAKFCANYGILFNSPSFRQLAERAFDIKPTKQLLFQQDDDSWVDPYRESVLFYNEQAYLNDYDQHIEATRTALEQAEVFVVTLGLNECWQFRDGSVMSRNPRINMYPLVTHKTLTVQENVDNIQTFYDIVKAHNPGFKLIISVSPIPFLATGRGKEHHVISANTHSKAVLRVAAEELVNSNENMYYLPSYELVTECIEDAWDEDQRHVKSSTVEQVVEMFKEIFIRE